MVKGSNPMQGYHRQKRQKEVQKNKGQRIKARDEKVVQTKTVEQVQEEIRNIKKRKNLQAAEQQRLQRLEKELKLVKEAAAGRPKEPLYIQEQQQAKPLTELDDPRKSVYYDEKMNPYGAPPPGQPRLYHHRGGGVTMDIRLAAVPGEVPPPPPPPPPPKSALAPRDDRREPRGSIANQHGTKTKPENSTPHRHYSSMGSRNEESSLGLQRNGLSQAVTDQENAKKVLQSHKPLVAPSLPLPSKSVQRSRRGKASVDIWASTEEVLYEKVANNVDLEADDVGATALKKTKPKTKKAPLQIFYQDRAGQVQGPFLKAQMLAWVAACFFPPSTLVKTNRNETWIPITDLPALRTDNPKPNQEDSVDDRIAALKDTSSVADRIAALSAKSRESEHDNDEESVGVLERIAVLRAAEQHDSTEAPAPPQEPSQDPPPYVVDVAAMPYPIVDSEVPPRYPMVDDYDDVPPPYPVDDDVDDAPAIARYPAEDEELPAYPVDEDVTYPTETTYPVPEGDDYAPHHYPVTEPYYGVDEGPGGDDGDFYQSGSPKEGAPIYPMPVPEATEPVKLVKVDKDLLAFMPSHLQSRKRKTATGQTATKQPKKANSVPSNNDSLR